jgi:catechol 2,3-dioxygenase-like lactoylglutathione lyase family enzyme
MKRLHVHVSVADVEQSVGFYSTLFGTSPSVLKGDYAKWMLDDPQVNFAISKRCGATPGLDHLGLQVEEGRELVELAARLHQAGEATVAQPDAACCYARGTSTGWSTPPACAGRRSTPPAS